MTSDELEVYVNRAGRLVVRSKPTGAPTEAQLLAQEAFTRAARKAKGRRMGDQRMPPAAAMVADELSGLHFGGKENVPKWKLALLRRLLDEGYSLDDAIAMMDRVQG